MTPEVAAPNTDPEQCPGVACDALCGPAGRRGACVCKPCACPRCVARAEHVTELVNRPRPAARRSFAVPAEPEPEPIRLFELPEPEEVPAGIDFRSNGARAL